MNIVKLVQQGQNLIFVGVNKDGEIKLGLLPISKVGKQKPEWFTPEIV